MRTITCLSPFVPYEQIPHAGGQFLHHYLNEMAAHAKVRLLSPDLAVNRHALSAGPPGVDVHLVPIDTPSPRLPARAIRCVRTRSNGLTLGLGEKRAFEGDATARDLVAESDVIEVHWSEFLQLVPLMRKWNPSASLVAVEYDVRLQSIRGRAREATRGRDRILATVAARRVQRREPTLVNGCDAVLTYTRKDVGILRGLGVTVPALVIAPYVFAPGPPVGPALDPTVLFVGAFDRPENAEGAMWFLDAVWPSVRDRCPEAMLTLAGAHPPEKLLNHGAAGVRVTGFVEDLDPLYRAARVVVCPLRSGGGLKCKVPQAMAYGLPVVATSVAADGIADISGTSVFGAITDRGDHMAAAVVGLLGDQSRATAVGARGRAWALDAYRFERSVSDVLDFYDRLA